MNPGNWIARNAGLTPDKAAIRFPGREISYAQLAQQVWQGDVGERVGTKLEEQGTHLRQRPAGQLAHLFQAFFALVPVHRHDFRQDLGQQAG